MALFSRVTGVTAKDCIALEPGLYFIVNPGYVGRAVGKQGMNIKKLQLKMNKKIKIIEYAHVVDKFVKNLLYPLQVEVSLDDKSVTIQCPDSKTKGQIIGRNAKNLNMLKNVVQRYFVGYSIQVV